MSKPKSFNDLSATELRRSAVEDFAVDIEDANNKNEVIAALTESGVTWSQYVAQHPEVAPEPAPEETHDVIPEDPEDFDVVVAEPEVKDKEKRYLLKMTRDNLVYETAGLRFTQEHPYALATADQADFIITKEDGFRQATPSELQEFYS